MFVPRDATRRTNDYPVNASIREQDWHILAAFWHPIAFAHDIQKTPVSAKLLDVDLVIYRTADGITVARDRCPHRGTKVSLGAVIDNTLVCPMHGIRFDSAGACNRIPSVADESARISTKMCLDTYQCEVRYDIVWTCLKPQPLWPLPVWQGIENQAFKKVHIPVDTWHCSAVRHVENFNDQAHFPFVHLQSFGSELDLTTHDYNVEHTEYGLRFDYDYTEGGNRFPDGVDAENRDVLYTYELTYPFSTLILVDPKGSDFVHYFADAVCPVSASETRVFQQCTDTTGNPDPEYWIKDSLSILEEDRPLVESQPPALPLAPGGELHHIPADRWSVEYRVQLLKRFGLGR